MEDVDEGIEREDYNCEINEEILRRNRLESILTKEKVKEIQKIVLVLDKKINSAKILETYALHQKEEASIEYDDYKSQIQKIKD